MDPPLKLSSIEQLSLNFKLEIPSGSPSAQESTQYYHVSMGDIDDDDDDESICGGYVPLAYSDECDLLPSASPVDHMHIIEYSDINEETNLNSLRLADGIATVLYNWKKEALNAFLDPKITSFELMRSYPKGSSTMSMIISRKRNKVMVG
jgi:hypothetical protein